MSQQAALNAHGALDGVAGRVENDKEPIARMVDLTASVIEEAAPQFRIHPGTEVAPRSIADRLDQAG